MAIFSPEQKRRQQRLSLAAAQYLDWVETHPEALERERFLTVAKSRRANPVEIQSWPCLIDAHHAADLADSAITLDRLMKGLFERYFHNAPERVAAFLGLGEEEVALMLSPPNGMAEAISRADCMLSDDGFKCVEINCGSHLGGWWVDHLAQAVLGDPLNQAFFRDTGWRARYPSCVRAVMTHMIKLASRRPTFDGRSLNVAITLPGSREAVYGEIHHTWIYKEGFRAALAEHLPGVRGRCLPCFAEDLQVRGDRVFVHGFAIDVIYEQHGDPTPFAVLRAAKSGGVELLTGPSSVLLLDKRLLALLSQHARDGLFSADEAEKIERYLPWTRLAQIPETTYRGETVRMVDLLHAQKHDLVIKDGTSGGGKGVHVGRFCSAERWDRAVREAVADPRYIVQSFIRAEPFVFQNGPQGCCDHDVIWGSFVVDGAYAGCHVRMMPVGGDGVVNAAQGAMECPVIELEPR